MRSPGDAVTLPALVAAAAERSPDAPALIAPGQRWSYRDLAAETARVARGLGAIGVVPGERVGVLLPNWPEFFSAVFGVQAAGGVAVCLNTMATSSELRHAIEHAELRRIVYTPRFLKHDYEATVATFPWRDAARLAFAQAGPLPPGALDFARFAPRPDGDAAAALRSCDRSAGDAPAAMFFTSGSTARPKAVVHSHRALAHQAVVCSERFGLDARDRLWGCLPMFFTGGFVAVALTSLASGAAVVLQDHFEAGAALDAMEREGVTFYTGWQLAPALCEHPTFPERRLRIRKGIFTDSPEAARLLSPDHVTIGVYGMSETATFVCQARFDDPPDLRQRGFGRPLPGVELVIADPETGAPRPPGEVGEVLVKGPSMMLGYLGRPLEETLDASGYLHTGDLGRIDETGTLRFAGRSKDVVRTAGVNVAAAEVEACLEQIGEVRSAYVVPVPHPVRGENVAAFVVPAGGGAIDAPRLLEHCRRELASYKVPRHLFVLEAAAIPRTGTQKVDKLALRATARDRAGGATDLAGGADRGGGASR
jgi:acyl-CoA synthetase (AMP-forming)/AMP-acid ligase II